MIPRIRRIKAILRSLSSASRNNNYRKYFPDSLGRRSIPSENSRFRSLAFTFHAGSREKIIEDKPAR